ncbi:lipase maturation factor family protein [Mycolicibacterium septicum DSM 44393]|uniref:Lipase maturation factor family protein n=1 Tax=Mycolicibacterium septicum DSM 44393 TaxID=1341646 RepID=A0A7X6RY17_9MYCO|nr:lipase maturation factor family protein [Mycolicibacterium septicum]NKZ13300.1 lipase maturation factor family protein [Mycolicibacterium septicum DSM 44393]
MEWFIADEYWLARQVLQRGTAAIYLIAFIVAARQFRGLLGERGLLPIPRFLDVNSFRRAPSLFQFHYSDRFFAAVCIAGAVISAALLAGFGDLVPLWAAMLTWLLVWMLYLSIVNVGQTWYSFGWESLLLEAGFLVMFLGNDDVGPPLLVLWLARWLLFRVEFGAGLIKLRGDPCWRNLTCLYYHHETQPMPGPLSWFFHHLPKPLHRIEVAGNHFAQLIVPFALFAPQPVASGAAIIVIVTQLWLVASGNFAWLNWITIVLAFSALSDSTAAVLLPLPEHEYSQAPVWFVVVVLGFTAAVACLSYWPARNLVSKRQRMNASYNHYHLVNSYGAFGTVGRTRDEVVLEGTSDPLLSDHTVWKEYEFKGKPGDVHRWPRQFAPYHLRLDWLMWFAAISPAYAHGWLRMLMTRLLENDRDTLKLLRCNPFPDEPPRYVRARLYRYEFSTWTELRRDHVWWNRISLGVYVPPQTLPSAGRSAAGAQ